jgi:hypothetical protein
MKYYISEKTIIVPYNFNEELANIPRHVEILIFDQENTKIKDLLLFDEKIKSNVLQNSLKKIILGFNFNKEIKPNVLPDSSAHLE